MTELCKVFKACFPNHINEITFFVYFGNIINESSPKPPTVFCLSCSPFIPVYAKKQGLLEF